MYDFTLRRSPRARRARLTVNDDGAVVVTLPARAPLHWAEQLVARESSWIVRHRTSALAETARLAGRRPLGEGGVITLHGIARLVTVASESGLRRPTIELTDDPQPIVHVRRPASHRQPLREILEAWLRRHARETIAQRVAVRAGELDVRAERLSIRDQRTRWASASRTGDLSFNWRLVLAPSSVLDYVVVHELAHLLHRGHGRDFWTVVHRALPEADDSREWLQRNGRQLRSALY